MMLIDSYGIGGLCCGPGAIRSAGDWFDGCGYGRADGSGNGYGWGWGAGWGIGGGAEDGTYYCEFDW